MENLKFNLLEILKELKMECTVSEKIVNYITKNHSFIEKASKEAYEGENPSFKICKRKPFTRLVIACYKLVELKNIFQERGLPKEVFIDTIGDITLRQEIYKQETGALGLSMNDVIWLRHLYNVHIFKLNTLQFQLFHMLYLDEETTGEEYMNFTQEQKNLLPSNVPVINVHIQKNADLSQESIEKSFSLAKEFFPKYFPEHEYKAFLCYSWLLYSGNRQLLNEDSNIVKFAAKFDIISEIKDNEQAVARIYGKKYRCRADYPQNTSLQKNALAHLDNLGYACGVIFLNKLHIGAKVN